MYTYIGYHICILFRPFARDRFAEKNFLHLNVSISRHISLLPLINIQHSYLSRQSIPQLKNHPTICFETVKYKWPQIVLYHDIKYDFNKQSRLSECTIVIPMKYFVCRKKRWETDRKVSIHTLVLKFSHFKYVYEGAI